VNYPIYLDNNATTPCDPRVLEEMLPYFRERFGNASSRSHLYGWEAAEAVNQARERVAGLIGSEPNEIVFTSGATEAINLAIKGVFEMYSSKGNHIITCSTEHHAVLDTCRHLEKLGAEITYLPVDENGLIDITELKNSLKPATILITVMFANNETGVIQDIKKISSVARENNVLFFTDATQAVGKIPVDVNADGIDLMAFSSHKIYGPKGVGALYIRRKNPRVRLTPQIDGGGQEKGLRSGTLNVPGIVGFGKAAELCIKEGEEERKRITSLRDKLEKGLANLEQSHVNGNKANRLPGVCHIRFNHVNGDALMMECNKEIALSSGSACSSASLDPSHVLLAMGQDDELAQSSVRFSLGRFNTPEEIDYTVKKVTEAVIRLREISPAWNMSETKVNNSAKN
jgi:cysteine desulfurase